MTGLTTTTLLLAALSAANPKDPKIPIERFQLDNGLKVVMSEDHSAPIVTVYITYRVGSAAEKEGLTGFAHLFEHMMFNGSKDVPEGGFAWYVDGTGGILNGNTEPDRTNYFETVPSNFLEGMLYLESNRMQNLGITEEALDNEKQVVKEEVRQQQENQPFLKTILLDWPATAFSSWEYSHSIYGSMDDLNNAPVQAFKDFFARWYVPNNATLVIVGDFDPKNAKELVGKYFAAIPKGEDNPGTFPTEKKQTEAVYKKVEDPLAPFPAIIMSWDIPPPRTADRDALDVLAKVLASGASSRLRKRLIDEDKTALEVIMQAGFPIPTYGPGQLALLAIANGDATPEKIRGALWEEIEKVQREGISKAELDRALTKVKVEYTQTLGDTLFKASELATYETFFGGADKWPKEIDRLQKLKPADLQRVAREYLTKEASVTFDIVPPAGNAGMGMGMGG
jgi:zinc protease